MQKYLTKVRNLLHKDKPAPSKAGYWLLPIGIIAVVGVGYLLADSPLFTADAAQIIPARNLTLYADVGEAKCNLELNEKLPDFCEQRDQLLTSLIGEYPQRISVFANQIIIASYNNLTDTGVKFAPTLLFRVTSDKNAEAFVKNLAGSETAVEETGQDMRILRFSEPQSRVVFFWKGWLIISPESDFYRQVADVDAGLAVAASDDVFWNTLHQKLGNTTPTVIFKSQLLTPFVAVGLQPLLDFVPEIGLALDHDKDKFLLKIVSNTPNTFFDQKPKIPSEDQGLLLAAFPDKSADLVATLITPKKEIDWALDYLEKTDPAFAFFVRGQTRRFLQELFGNEISLENDILPLFDNQVTFALYQNDSRKADFLITLDTNDASFAAAKKEKLLSALQNAAANFVPRILEHVLEDGSIIREVAACDDCVQSTTETIGGAELTTFVTENNDGATRTLSLGLSGDIFVIATQATDARTTLTNLTTEDENILPEIVQQYDEFVVAQPKIIATFFPNWSNLLNNFAEITVAQNSDIDFFNLVISAPFREKEAAEEIQADSK